LVNLAGIRGKFTVAPENHHPSYPPLTRKSTPSPQLHAFSSNATSNACKSFPRLRSAACSPGSAECTSVQATCRPDRQSHGRGDARTPPLMNWTTYNKLLARRPHLPLKRANYSHTLFFVVRPPIPSNIPPTHDKAFPRNPQIRDPKRQSKREHATSQALFEEAIARLCVCCNLPVLMRHPLGIAVSRL
jgi:hypothetical protein